MSKILEERMTTDNLLKLAGKFGGAFYLLDSPAFRENCIELVSTFRSVYPKFNIAYSYKTNYMPKLVKIVDELGGYAEVVSHMEMEIALRCGVIPDHIIWNGPVKNYKKVQWLLLNGGTINIDSACEADIIESIAAEYPDRHLNVGIRCNFDVNDGVDSRFGIDIDGIDFDYVLGKIRDTPNIIFSGLQCHFAKRSLQYWPHRVKGMLTACDKAMKQYGMKPERIDLGGGIYGKMADSLKKELGIDAQEYSDYAEAAAGQLVKYFKDVEDPPMLFIEPGSAVAGDCMKFVCRIESIKTIRGKTIATVSGSQKNIGMAGINPPIKVVAGGDRQKDYVDVEFAGFTCIESDIIARGYNGPMTVGDFLIISNCGSYSVVMKPPFILPNVPVLDICDDDGVENPQVIKRAEEFDDLFRTYAF